MGSAEEGNEVHRAGLSREMLFVEGLTNLDRLPPRGASFVFLPVKIAAASGARPRDRRAAVAQPSFTHLQVGECRMRSDPVLRVGEVEAAAGVPLGALVAMSRDAASVLENPRQVQHVPGGEGGVAVGEVILGAA